MINISSRPIWGYNYDRRQEAAYRCNPSEYGNNLKKVEESKKNFMFGGNLVRALGSIPGLNVIVGIAMAIFFSIAYSEVSDNEQLKKDRALAWIFRSVVTILVGPLLPIVDLIVTLVEMPRVDAVLQGEQA